jgi:CMP-N,N'-diacetyllegionaminic acid synthase
MWKGKTVLAVIPCRIGSKGIPRKNLTEVLGYSLIERVTAFALSLEFVDEVVISTDSDEVKSIFPDYALKTEGTYLHSDNCKGTDIWKDALVRIESEQSNRFDLSIYLEPSSPLRSATDVIGCLDSLETFPSAATVSETQKKFCPEKQILDSVVLEFYNGKHVTNRQSIPKYFHLNGCCYAAKRETILTGDLFKNCSKVVSNHITVNIDDDYDLQIAELFLKFRTLDS